MDNQTRIVNMSQLDYIENNMFPEINKRTQQIFKIIVETYMESGDPIGSRTISKQLDSGRFDFNLSPASIRNIMADLEAEGLLYAPHKSAGRLPTESGLRLFIDGLMEIGNLSKKEQQDIEKNFRSTEALSHQNLLEQTSSFLSGLSSAASLVIAPKTERPIKQIQFMKLDERHILIILVTTDGVVENRMFEINAPISESTLQKASNYLNHVIAGKTLSDARQDILQAIKTKRAELDALTTDLISRGIALETGTQSFNGHIFVRGQSNLLNDVKAIEDLEKAQTLMAMLEEQDHVSRLLDATQEADGVQVFIGAQNDLFQHSGWSMVLSPYHDTSDEGHRKVIGAIGVIGPMRLNYSRIVPVVDYTSKIISKLLETQS